MAYDVESQELVYAGGSNLQFADIFISFCYRKNRPMNELIYIIVGFMALKLGLIVR
jgi:hypothetical protein